MKGDVTSKDDMIWERHQQEPDGLQTEIQHNNSESKVSRPLSTQHL